MLRINKPQQNQTPECSSHPNPPPSNPSKYSSSIQPETPQFKKDLENLTRLHSRRLKSTPLPFSPSDSQMEFEQLLASPLGSNFLGNLIGDSFIQEMKNDEGNPLEGLCPMFALYFVKSLLTPLISKYPELNDILPRFTECLEFSQQITACASLSLEDQRTRVVEIVDAIKEKAKQLKPGEKLLLPGGWTADPYGHTMLVEITLNLDGTFRATLFNTGSGAEFHEFIPTSSKRLINPAKTYPNISYQELIDGELIENLLELQCFNPVAERHREYGAYDLEALFTFSGRISVSREGSDALVFDEGIAPAISEEKNRADDSLAGDRKLTEKVNKADLYAGKFAPFDSRQTERKPVFRTPQRAGTCPIRVLLAYLQSLMNNYKLLRLDMNNLTLGTMLKVHQGHLAAKPKLRELLQNCASVYANQLITMYKRNGSGAASSSACCSSGSMPPLTEGLELVESIFQEIEDASPKKNRDPVEFPQQLDPTHFSLEITQALNALAKKREPISMVGDPQVATFRQMRQPEIWKKDLYENCIEESHTNPDLFGSEFTPQNLIAKLTKVSDLCEEMQKVTDFDLAFYHSIVALRKLPLLGSQEGDAFWRRVDKKTISTASQLIEKLVKVLKERDLQWIIYDSEEMYFAIEKGNVLLYQLEKLRGCKHEQPFSLTGLHFENCPE
ncbi:MAG: hypothetical protein ACHQUC_10555, partial [Chlamydiales bacterium]